MWRSSDIKTLNRPLLFVDPANNSLRPTDERAALDQIKGKSTNTLYTVQVAGTSGTTFATDLEAINNVFGTGRKAGASVAAANSPLSILRSYTVAFLDQYLKKLPVSLLDSTANTPTGVQMEIIEAETK
jgi:hypothetical protein